jgi:hypothetical protein
MTTYYHVLIKLLKKEESAIEGLSRFGLTEKMVADEITGHIGRNA